MRPLILLAGPALLLAACSNDGQTDNTINADQSLSAETFSSNDLTAIDAVTGAASNMAADVNFVAELDNDIDLDSPPPGKGDTTASTRRRASDRPASAAPKAADQPVANASANAAAPTGNSL